MAVPYYPFHQYNDSCRIEFCGREIYRKEETRAWYYADTHELALSDSDIVMDGAGGISVTFKEPIAANLNLGVNSEKTIPSIKNIPVDIGCGIEIEEEEGEKTIPLEPLEKDYSQMYSKERKQKTKLIPLEPQYEKEEGHYAK